MRCWKLDYLRHWEHLKAVPARLFRLGFLERLIAANHFIIELRQVHNVPHEPTIVVSTKVTKQERFLGLLCLLLLCLRFLFLSYLLRLLVFLPCKSYFLSSLGSIFIFLLGFFLGFSGVSPCGERCLELPLLLFLVIFTVKQGIAVAARC
jgi:hypothetical protein